MIRHLDLVATPEERKAKIGLLIRSGEIKLGGYQKGKIYGTLTCSAGKRMKVENRVFFRNETEALGLGYRPCGHCMPDKYNRWKEGEAVTFPVGSPIPRIPALVA
jgi:hypothetical protein